MLCIDFYRNQHSSQFRDEQYRRDKVPDIATLQLQIQFCETYLANHTDPSDPKNTKEIREYLEKQLAIARQLLEAAEAVSS